MFAHPPKRPAQFSIWDGFSGLQGGRNLLPEIGNFGFFDFPRELQGYLRDACYKREPAAGFS